MDVRARVLLRDMQAHVGTSVVAAGHIGRVRDHGKLFFFEVRDRSGTIQCVALSEEVSRAVRALGRESVLVLQAVVKERPKGSESATVNGTLELGVSEVAVLSAAQELPFDFESELQIETLFDYRPLTLRRPDEQALARLQACIVRAFREALAEETFVEIQTPKLTGDDAEGGANVFTVPYFQSEARLATSPQLYKQIMVGALERVYTVGNVYRAEKHSTSRHLNEYTSLDAEFGFITDHRDVMALLERVMRRIVREVQAQDIACVSATLAVPDTFPVLKLPEAQELLEQKYAMPCKYEPDLSPEHERTLCEHARAEHQSDFLFITHYPVAKRPVYTYEDETMPGYTKSFDLLFRGVEIATGGQRIHQYEHLVQKMQERGLRPEQFAFYLQAFKYGMPPHGGFGMGLERVTAKCTDHVHNVKEAALFPRDRTRIDKRLSE